MYRDSPGCGHSRPGGEVPAVSLLSADSSARSSFSSAASSSPPGVSVPPPGQDHIWDMDRSVWDGQYWLVGDCSLVDAPCCFRRKSKRRWWIWIMLCAYLLHTAQCTFTVTVGLEFIQKKIKTIDNKFYVSSRYYLPKNLVFWFETKECCCLSF